MSTVDDVHKAIDKVLLAIESIEDTVAGSYGGRGDLGSSLGEYDEALLALRDVAGSAEADSPASLPTSFIESVIGDGKSPESVLQEILSVCSSESRFAKVHSSSLPREISRKIESLE